MLGEQVPAPGEGEGIGFVAREEYGHRFVPELLVAHPLTLFVSGAQQHGEQIAGVLTTRTALVYDCVDELVELLYRPAEPKIGWRGQGPKKEPQQFSASLFIESLRD